MNLLAMTGNLGRDAEVRQAGSSTVCSFAVALSSGWGDKKTTTWLNCSLWGKQAEGTLPSYLKKGQQVALTGELSTREYQAKDGTMKTSLELRVGTIDLIGKRDDNSGGQASQPAAQQLNQQSAPPDNNTFDSDIPFANPYRGRRALLI